MTSHPRTVSELRDRFLEWAITYYQTPPDEDGQRRPTGEHTNLRDATKAIVMVAGDLPIDAVTAETLCAARDWMLRQRRRDGRPWTRKEVNNRINRIRRMFKWGRKAPYRFVPTHVITEISADLVEHLKYGRSDARETEDVQPARHDDVTDVMSVCGPQLYAMIDIQLNTGMRPGELVRMRRSEITVEQARLADGKSSAIMVYRPLQHKTRHHGLDRNIFLGPESMRTTEDWLRRLPPPETVDRLFHYTTNSYREAIVRIIKAYGFNHWTPAQLRHSFATRMRESAGIDVTQVLMGHRHRSTTEIYAAPDAASAIAAIMRFG